MSRIIVGFFLLFSTSVILRTLAVPTYSANDDGTVSVFVDPEEYETLGAEDIMSAMQSKRFWSPHPSDYNPLRRPVPVPRGSKRDDYIPYHPIPRIVTMKQRSLGNESPENNYEELIDGAREKKQTRATTLIFRLGSWGLRTGKNKHGPPPTPSSSNSA